MTPPQWEEIVVRVEAAWGKSAKWKGAVAMYEDASSVVYPAAMRAVKSFVDAGEAFAPSIPELLSRARSFEKPKKVDRDTCTHPEWGIVERSFDGDTALCRVCGVEKQIAHDSMLTVGQLDESTR